MRSARDWKADFTVDIVYSKEQLEKPRTSPFGSTEREQKEGLEFDGEEYDEIDNY